MNNIMQMLQALINPQHLMNNLMGNNQMMNNPMIKNAVDMAQRGDSQGLEQLVRNIAQTKGVNVDEMFQQVKSQIKF
jgi:hypothetical protein